MSSGIIDRVVEEKCKKQVKCKKKNCKIFVVFFCPCLLLWGRGLTS
jgi:hypothetical protein